MEEEIKKTASSHEISIALIQKDIQYMRESVFKIEQSMVLIDKNFARKDELQELETIVTTLAKNTDEKLKEKVNHTDFDPISKTLYRINWILISSFIVGLLALLVASNKGS